MHLVEQFRYPVGARFWEFPQGAWEDTPEADPRALAAAELREETGLLADAMTYVGPLFQGYGYATQGYHVFVARSLRPTARQLDPEEQGLIGRRFAWTALLSMIADGTIRDAATVAALGLARIKGLLDLPPELA